MSANDYMLEAEAHQKIHDRLALAAEPKVSSRQAARIPGPRRRHALARQLRRMADALDN